MWTAPWWAGLHWKCGVLPISSRTALKRKHYELDRWYFIVFFSDGLPAADAAGVNPVAQEGGGHGPGFWRRRDRCPVRRRQRHGLDQDDKIHDGDFFRADVIA